MAGRLSITEAPLRELIVMLSLQGLFIAEGDRMVAMIGARLGMGIEAQHWTVLPKFVPRQREWTLGAGPGRGSAGAAASATEIVPARGPAPPVNLEGPEGFATEQAVTLQQRAPVPITAVFEVNPDKPGEVFEFDLVHLLSSGRVFGGLRVAVLTTA